MRGRDRNIGLMALAAAASMAVVAGDHRDISHNDYSPKPFPSPPRPTLQPTEADLEQIDLAEAKRARKAARRLALETKEQERS